MNYEGPCKTSVNCDLSRGLVVMKFTYGGEPYVAVELKPDKARELAVQLMDRANGAEPSESFIRASGDVTCAVCGDYYRHHPSDMKQVDHDGHPFLRVRCDGRRLKL